MKGSFFVSEREAPIPKAYEELWIGADERTAQPARIAASTISGGRPLLSTDLAKDRTAAESLVGKLVWVERGRVEALEEDEAGSDEGEADADKDAGGDLLLWGDLPGLIVVDSNGLALGKITEVYNTGASDIVTLIADDGGALDVPLVETYVDFDVGVVAGKLTLVVEASVFDELWQR